MHLNPTTDTRVARDLLPGRGHWPLCCLGLVLCEQREWRARVTEVLALCVHHLAARLEETVQLLPQRRLVER